MIGFYVLLVIVVMIAMSQVWPDPQWNQNLHLILAQEITRILHKNDCWVCTQMPRYSERGVSLIGVPLPPRINWTSPDIWANTTLSKNPPSSFLELEVNTLNLTLNNTTPPCINSFGDGPFVGKYSHCDESVSLNFTKNLTNVFINLNYTRLPVPKEGGWYWLCGN